DPAANVRTDERRCSKHQLRATSRCSGRGLGPSTLTDAARIRPEVQAAERGTTCAGGGKGGPVFAGWTAEENRYRRDARISRRAPRTNRRAGRGLCSDSLSRNGSAL